MHTLRTGPAFTRADIVKTMVRGGAPHAFLVVALVWADSAGAQVAPPPQPTTRAPVDDAPTLKVTPTGYVETNYSWNFNEPSNLITNYRGYDNRYNTFTLANVALGADVEYSQVSARLVLQVGHTPDTYYLSEPASIGTSVVGTTDANYWKFLQEAYAGWRAPLGTGLLLQAGLFLSPIGAESIAVHDTWNWSRSNLFFVLPAYHTGVRATYDFSKYVSLSVAGFNGWNSVVDNNDEKSVCAYVDYQRGIVRGRLLYFGGVERATGAPEGPYWRHDFDFFGRVDVTPHLSFMTEANAGFEPNRFGTSSWVAGALYARVKATPWLYFIARGDAFYESVPTGASPIFWPVDWVSSGTATIDFRPIADHISIRLEYRHDEADGLMFFQGQVAGDGSTLNPYVVNARRQDTLTLGATTWF